MSDIFAELVGSLISAEFIDGGRIAQLWVSDPDMPDEREEFQFSLGSVLFADEDSSDYLPGTFLVGVRTGKDDPWVVSRNEEARLIEENDDFTSISFEYDLPLVPDLRATGRFYERKGPLPVVVWELSLRNASFRSLEIGELGFPFALNNFCEGFGPGDDETSRLWASRAYIHKFIGGGASYIFGQRMTGNGPGLLICPGRETAWEFYHHAQSSLRSEHLWEGVPIVYVHSRASIEREGWPAWRNGHSSRTLNPGETMVTETLFAPAVTGATDRLSRALVALKKPAIRIFPAAVAPYNVGASVEVAAPGPVEFDCGESAQMETDSDESGGFAFLKASQPGEVRLDIKPFGELPSSIHLNFIPEIETLIKARAGFIAERGGQLADYLFLAEKNAIYPVASEIEKLESFIDDELFAKMQNPGTLAVAQEVDRQTGMGANFGSPQAHAIVLNLHLAMFRSASTYGGAARSAEEYLRFAYGTAEAMFREASRFGSGRTGSLGIDGSMEVCSELGELGRHDEQKRLFERISNYADILMDRQLPWGVEAATDTSPFAEAFLYAGINDEGRQAGILHRAYAARSLAPSWWWYGSDKRIEREAADNGEACMAWPTVANSRLFFTMLRRDYSELPERYLRLAFGGMLGPWALVNADGSASESYCPDVASRRYGPAPSSGSIGLGLYEYLRSVGAFVLPGGRDFQTFGCTYEFADDVHEIHPWDGVGRRVALRQVSALFVLSFGTFVSIRLDARKRWFEVVVKNPADKAMEAKCLVSGLWGSGLTSGGKTFGIDNGDFKIDFRLPANDSLTIRGEVCE
ncbi:MAG: DUF5695 domain-containing protein [Fimbriimonadales bacterium]